MRFPTPRELFWTKVASKLVAIGTITLLALIVIGFVAVVLFAVGILRVA